MVLHTHPHHNKDIPCQQKLHVAVGIYILYGPEWRRYMLGHGAVGITSRLEQRRPRRWDTVGDSDHLHLEKEDHPLTRY
jgi:hypothetical protein